MKQKRPTMNKVIAVILAAIASVSVTGCLSGSAPAASRKNCRELGWTCGIDDYGNACGSRLRSLLPHEHRSQGMLRSDAGRHADVVHRRVRRGDVLRPALHLLPGLRGATIVRAAPRRHPRLHESVASPRSSPCRRSASGEDAGGKRQKPPCAATRGRGTTRTSSSRAA